MACYCGRSERGVWDRRGILHTASECRFRDHLVSPTYAYI